MIDKCFCPFKKNPKHSKINTKKLNDYDLELLHRLVNKKYNKILVVLNNEKYYSEDVIKTYKEMKESLKRIQDAIELKYESVDINEIQESW